MNWLIQKIGIINHEVATVNYIVSIEKIVDEIQLDIHKECPRENIW